MYQPLYYKGSQCSYLDEGVDVTDGWDEVGDERFQLVVQLNGLGCVPATTQHCD